MPDPTATTLLGIPGFVYLWVLAAVAFVLFGLRAYRILAVVARGRAEPRWDQLPRRAWSVVVNVAGQRRMFDNPGVGLAHLVIFWAFLFYAGSFAWNLLRGLLPFLPIPYPDEIVLISVPMLLLSLATLVALAGAAIRRYVVRPPRLAQSRDAGLILLLITLLVVTYLVGQAAAAGLGNLSTSTAETVYTAMWWIHIVAVLAFLAYLPYSKHLHLLASPFNVFTASLAHGRDAAAVGGGRAPGAVHLAGAVQRPLLRRMRPVRPGLPGVRRRPGALAAGPHPRHEADGPGGCVR